MSPRGRTLARDTRGSAIVEFGILAPIILMLLIGIVQVGLWMWNYNSLRSVAADTGRYVAVEYQKSNQISNVSMALWARDHAVDTYMLNEAVLSTDVTDAGAQNIPGVTEKTLTLTYTMTSFLDIAGVLDIPVTFTRPIFVKT